MSETYGLLLPFWDAAQADDAQAQAIRQWRKEAEQVGVIVTEPTADLLKVTWRDGQPLVLHDNDGEPTQPTQAWRVTGQVARHAPNRSK